MDAQPGIGGAELARASGADALASRARDAARRGDAGEAAERFEELLATMLVRELRRALPESPFGDGAGAGVYEGWFDEHLGRSLAESWDLDLAGLVKESLVRKQEAAGR